MTKTVAVVGASGDRHKYGNKCVRAYASAGWRVYPINPRGGEIEGLEALPDLAALPEPPDLISVYLPPRRTLGLLDEIAAAGATETIFNPGSADAAVIERAEELGIQARQACSIVDIGLSPAQFP